MADPNLEQLISAALILRPMLDELVFVGGCTTGLLITDPATPEVRATVDVDAIVEITSYAAYADFSVRLNKLGLRVDTEAGAPICRWRHGELRIDVMPLDENILGFSNRWYRLALDTAQLVKLNDDVSIRAINAPFFLATKMEAFRGRGQGYLGSHDLEDIIAVVDGRGSLVDEVRASDPKVREYIAAQTQSMLNERAFRDAIPGFLTPDTASQDRVPMIFDRLQQLVTLDK